MWTRQTVGTMQPKCNTLGMSLLGMILFPLLGHQAPVINSPLENSFLALIQTIADAFEVSNCWICGGPQWLSQWPWVAVPLSPVWILSNRSVVHDRTRFWTSQEKHQWSLSESVPGEHCINQTGPVETRDMNDPDWDEEINRQSEIMLQNSG